MGPGSSMGVPGQSGGGGGGGGNNWMSQLWKTLNSSSSPKPSMELYSALDLVKMSRDVDRLKNVAQSLGSIWNGYFSMEEMLFQNETAYRASVDVPLESPFLSSAAPGVDGEEEETQFMRVAPGVWAPQTQKDKPVLTWRGKEQVGKRFFFFISIRKY